MIRVLLADDHPVVREGLRGMLSAESDIAVAGEAASGAEAVALFGSLRPDVVLMDLRMPGGDGVDAIEKIRAGHGGAAKIIGGETVLAPAVAGRLVSQVRGPGHGALSARETEVLGLVARGLTNVQIGRALFVSEATVKTHLMRACGKLGVTGRTAAVTKAMETGALPPPGGSP